MRTTLHLLLSLLSVPSNGLVAAAPEDGDWPAYRRDAGLTGMSPLVGRYEAAPVKLWTHDLGGALQFAEDVRLDDVNGDGQREVVRVLRDRLVCQSLEGEVIWRTEPIHRPTITSIHDFAGDGTRGLLVRSDTGVELHRYIVDGKSGNCALLYSRRNVFGSSERIGHLVPNVPGQQICAWWSGDPLPGTNGNAMRGVGYLWSFENGLNHPTLRFQASESGVIYSPLHLFADVNADGRDEMLMISHEKLWVYDLKSGERLFTSVWGPRIRTYWANVGAMPLTAGAPLSLLMINPMMPGVQVATLDGKQMVRRWKRVIGDREDQYQSKIRVNRAAPDPFVDLDGDGDIEILVSVINEHGDDRTYLTVFDALSGDRLYDAPDKRVLTVDELDGHAPPEVLIEERTEAGTTLRISHWDGTRFENVWSGKGVEPLLVPAPSEGHLQRSTGARTTERNMPLWRVKKGSEEFLLKFPKGVHSCRLHNGVLERGTPIGSHPALDMADDLANERYDPRWNGQTLTIKRHGERVVTYRRPQQRVYSPTPPLVGTLGGQRVVVSRTHAGQLVDVSKDGTRRQVLVKRSPSSLGTCIVDLDGDGAMELLTVREDDAQSRRVVVVDATGQETLRIEPPPRTTEVLLGPTGRLGPSKGRWFSVRYRIRADNTQVTTYDGRTGKPIWTRDYLGPSRVPSTTFVLHLPTAVHDVDGDGGDDLLASSENFYEVISGRDNRSLTPNVVITAVVPGHWGAYATPIVVPAHSGKKAQVFHNNAYALTLLTELDGTPVWHFGLTRDTMHAGKMGLADLDADGTVEFVTTQKDGLLRAFDAHARDRTCPRCHPNQTLQANNRSGHVRWEFRLPPPVSDFATCDLDGDGRGELLCGAGDGKLYALQETGGACTPLWTIDLGAPVLAPIIADVDEDGRPEIVVSTSDGRLHCLGREEGRSSRD